MVGKGWMIALGMAVLVSAGPVRGAEVGPNLKHQDIGAPTRPGSSTYDAAKGTWTVTGEGNDIWGADTDNFQFAYTELQGDGNITARILSQEGGHDDGWGRNGLMIREDLTTGSRHLDYVLGTPDLTAGNSNSQGVFYSYFRPEANSDQMTWSRTLGNFPQYEGHAANRGAAGLRELPMWVRIQRQGNLITAYISPDGRVWSAQIVPQALKLQSDPGPGTPLPATMFVGLVANGHNPDADTGTLSTIVFDNVSVSNDLLGAWPTNVEATASRSDNRVLVTWSGRPNATAYTIYRQAVGEQQYTKAGTSENVTWFIDAGADGNGLAAGTNYRYVVTATVDGKESAASYPDMVTPGTIPSAIGPFLSHDIGTARAGSTTLDSNGVLTITASGLDFWNAGDGGRFVGTTHDGNITMTAKVLEKPTTANQDGWGRAGLMIRESLDPAAREASVFVNMGGTESDVHSPVHFQWRLHHSNSADESLGSQQGTESITYPHWLRITRNFDRIEGFQSSDGTTFTKVGGDEGGITLPRLPARVHVGFAVSNHRDGDFMTAKFDANSVKFE
jgi:hypothetical protein